MESQSEFRITADLSDYFNDSRNRVRLFINKDMTKIKHIHNKIKEIFLIRNFHLTCRQDYLPPSEDIRIIQPNEIIRVNKGKCPTAKALELAAQKQVPEKESSNPSLDDTYKHDIITCSELKHTKKTKIDSVNLPFQPQPFLTSPIPVVKPKKNKTSNNMKFNTENNFTKEYICKGNLNSYTKNVPVPTVTDQYLRNNKVNIVKINRVEPKIDSPINLGTKGNNNLPSNTSSIKYITNKKNSLDFSHDYLDNISNICLIEANGSANPCNGTNELINQSKEASLKSGTLDTLSETAVNIEKTKYTNLQKNVARTDSLTFENTSGQLKQTNHFLESSDLAILNSPSIEENHDQSRPLLKKHKYLYYPASLKRKQEHFFSEVDAQSVEKNHNQDIDPAKKHKYLSYTSEKLKLAIEKYQSNITVSDMNQDQSHTTVASSNTNIGIPKIVNQTLNEETAATDDPYKKLALDSTDINKKQKFFFYYSPSLKNRQDFIKKNTEGVVPSTEKEQTYFDHIDTKISTDCFDSIPTHQTTKDLTNEDADVEPMDVVEKISVNNEKIVVHDEKIIVVHDEKIVDDDKVVDEKIFSNEKIFDERINEADEKINVIDGVGIDEINDSIDVNEAVANEYIELIPNASSNELLEDHHIQINLEQPSELINVNTSELYRNNENIQATLTCSEYLDVGSSSNIEDKSYVMTDSVRSPIEISGLKELSPSPIVTKTKYQSKERSGIGSLLEQLRNDSSGLSSLDISSQSENNNVTKRKRRRIRKRKMKSTQPLVSSPLEIHPAPSYNFLKSKARPLMHLRFDETEDSVQILDVTDAKETSIETETVNIEDSVFVECDEQNYIDEKDIKKAPSMKDLLPKVGDLISFKILKMNDVYTPEISSYITGKVVEFQNGQVIFDIMAGLNQFKDPVGKLSLPSDEPLSRRQRFMWNDLIEPHLLFP